MLQDEIDAIASSRSGDDSGGSHDGVLTSLLNEMDGVQELVGVTVVAATNRPDVIVSQRIILCNCQLTHKQDSALMRPGRLDRILYVGPPDVEGRKEILNICTHKMSVEPGLDIEELARMVGATRILRAIILIVLQTDGCSGAEMAALCQEAALAAMKKDMDARFVRFPLFLLRSHCQWR